MAALAIGIGLSGSAAWVAEAAAQDEGYAAYVNTTALNLRAGPGTNTNVVGILLKYDRIRVLERTTIGRATWYSVEAGGGYTNGWVSARYIEFGEAPTGAGLPEGPVDYGARETPTLIKGSFKYQGPGACRECHMEPTGAFHLGASQVWEHHVHSSAYKTLQREYTKEIARRARGIEDPANDWRCVKCHVTAFGADKSQIAPSYSQDDGVTCEVCHGPSSEYADADHGPDVRNREAMGFRILKDLHERREVCTSCHNPASPTYVPFNLREFSRDIAHWVDQGDSHYYADAGTEAKRRDEAVEKARRERAAKELAERKQAEAEAAAAAQSDAERKAAAEARAEAERKEKERLAALGAKQREEEERRKAAADKAAEQAAAEAEAKRMAAEEERRADEERRKAEAALAAEKAAAADNARKAEAARKKAEEQARASAAKATGVERFLEDVDEKIKLNTDGDKYNPVTFAHLAHASNKYMPDGKCQTCHHTQEGDESPQACSECHEIGGDADEEKKKSRAVHKKDLPFPKAEGQEQVSCIGCHKSQNQLLAMGKRTGKEAPTKCTKCHSRK